ncbi:hypothetical protein [Mycolicibacterium sp. CBMA 234]|uniref:hypothetical protein n=1 Tax=Mycolicibacterium sp. CBMA 234 TaxID=1918495 RepID=UPI0012DE48E6|nr:hypothetical protein [Mycolicibacterium sp. CBMA 234]
MVAGGGIWWWFLGGAESWARSQWTPPKQALLSPLVRQPTPGWRTSIADLGLPADARINAGKTSWEYPIIKTTSSRTYLLARTPGPPEQWWLAGIDGTSGRPLFPAVPMGKTREEPRCFPNGADVVCISDPTGAPSTAWVIDGQSGALIYTGPTELRLDIGAQLSVDRTPNYLVAMEKGLGAYGVGRRAEKTWYVPGFGNGLGSIADDIAFGGKGPGDVVMFSVKDGRQWSPRFPSDAVFTNCDFFEGGFAGEFDSGSSHRFVQLFDATGNPINDRRIKGRLVGVTGNLVEVLGLDHVLSIYDTHGRKVLEMPSDSPRNTYLTGTRLWISDETDSVHYVYRAHDIPSGAIGKPCPLDFSDYLGTDGAVTVRAPRGSEEAASGQPLAQAYDLTTCELAWTIPRPRGSLGTVERLGDTLVRLSDDGTELFSLVNH